MKVQAELALGLFCLYSSRDGFSNWGWALPCREFSEWQPAAGLWEGSIEEQNSLPWCCVTKRAPS